jgi:hypothetical protein
MNTQAQKMTVISNIQSMQKVIGGLQSSFEDLNKLSLDALRKLQDELIPEYNKALTPMTPLRAVGIIEDGHDQDELLEAWSYLIRTGLVWSLQGSYGRAASNLIENEIISLTGEIL